LVFLGLGGFALSFALSTLFLVQRRRLKRKEFHDVGHLPSMETLDSLNFTTQCIGFAALTAGVAMGVFLLTQSSGTRGIDDITVWGTCAVWLWYAAGLHARVVLGWRGRTAAIFGVVGFGSLGAVLAVVTAFFGGWHGS
ncbi:MAG: cytochrome c biogenesis protein CcsA, partial [Myxococcota bacterium]